MAEHFILLWADAEYFRSYILITVAGFAFVSIVLFLFGFLVGVAIKLISENQEYRY